MSVKSNSVKTLMPVFLGFACFVVLFLFLFIFIFLFIYFFIYFFFLLLLLLCFCQILPANTCKDFI